MTSWPLKGALFKKKNGKAKKTKEKYEAGGWKWWTMPTTASARVWTAAVAAMRFVDVGVVPNLSSREAAR